MTAQTDRELLEAAARAAGIYEEWPKPDYGVQWNGEGLWCFGNGEGYLWNPLDDDGQALRLAVKLRLSVQHYARSTGVMCVQAVIDWGLCNDAFHEDHGPDPYAATRRAITCAAAAIGAHKEGD